MRITHNLPALNAFRNLSVTQGQTAKAMEKLTSSLRINRAADDAAGLAISETMRGQIKGLNQASRNSQDAISLLQTAEGALTETHSILDRMRELATQAANDTYTSNDRTEMQKEVDQLKSEVDRISNTTTFNGKNLLDGTTSAITSTDKVDTQVFLRGAIAKSGSYQLSITAQAGNAQIQKSSIFKINQGIVMNNLDVDSGSGVNNATANDLQYGDYTIDTTVNNANGASALGNSTAVAGTLYALNAATPPADIFGGSGLSVDAANTNNMSLLAQVTNVAADGKSATYQMSWHSLAQDGTASDGSSTVTLDLTHAGNTFTLGGTTFTLNTTATNSKLTVGDKQVFTATGNTNNPTGTGTNDTLAVNLAGTGALAKIAVTSGVLNNKTTDFAFYSVDAASGQIYDGDIALNIGGLTGSSVGFSNVDTGSINLTTNLSAGSAGTAAVRSTGAINFNAGNLTAHVAGTGGVASTGAISFNAGNLTAHVTGATAAASTGAINFNAGNLTAGSAGVSAVASSGAIKLNAGNLSAGTTGVTAVASTGAITFDAGSLSSEVTGVTAAAATGAINFDAGNLTAGSAAVASTGVINLSSGNLTAYAAGTGSVAATGAIDLNAGNLSAASAAVTASGAINFNSGNLTAQATAAVAAVGAINLTGDLTAQVTAKTAEGFIFLDAGNLVDTPTYAVGSLQFLNGFTGSLSFILNGYTIHASDMGANGVGTHDAAALVTYITNRSATLGVTASIDSVDNRIVNMQAIAIGSAGNSITLDNTLAGNKTNEVLFHGGVSRDTVIVNGTVLSAGIQFARGATEWDTAANLAAYIHTNKATLGVDANNVNHYVRITANTPGTGGNSIGLAISKGSVTAMTGGVNAVTGDTITVGSSTYTAGVDFNVFAGNPTLTASSLSACLSGKNGVDAWSSNRTVNLTATTAGAAGNGIALATTAVNAGISGSHLVSGADTVIGGGASTATGSINLTGNLTAQVNAQAASGNINFTAGNLTATTQAVGSLEFGSGFTGSLSFVLNGYTIHASDIGANGVNTHDAAALVTYITNHTATLGVTASIDSVDNTKVNMQAIVIGSAGNSITLDNTLAGGRTNEVLFHGGTDGNTVTVNGTVLTAGIQFARGATASVTAANLAAYIHTNKATLGVDATNTGNTAVNITANIVGTAGNSIGLATTKGTVTAMTGGVNAVTGDTITVGSSTYTAGVDFAVTAGNTTATAASLATFLNNKNGVTATSSNGVVNLTATASGTAGNSIALATTSAKAGISSSHLTGGAAGITGDTVNVNGTVLTAGVNFAVGGTAATTAGNLATYIHAHTGTLGVDATNTSGNTAVNIIANTAGTVGNSIALTTNKGTVTAMNGGSNAIAANTVNVNGNILTAGTTFAVGGTAAATAANLANYIHTHTGTLGVDATNTPGNTKISLTATTAGVSGNSINLATSKGAVTAMSGGSDGVATVWGDTVDVAGYTLRAGLNFAVGATAAATASNLANLLQSYNWLLGFDSTNTPGSTVINLTATSEGTWGDGINLGISKGAVTSMHGGKDAVAADTVDVNGNTLTAGLDFNVGATAADTANNLISYIQTNSGALGVNAAIDSGTNTQVDITANTPGWAGDFISLGSSTGTVSGMSGGVDGVTAIAGDTISINGHTLTAGVDFNPGWGPDYAAWSLYNYIQMHSVILGVNATLDGMNPFKINISANTAGTAGDTINLATSKGSTTAMSGGVDATATVAADTVNVNGINLTAGLDFNVGATAADTTTNLINFIHTNKAALGVDATINGGNNIQVDITANTKGTAGDTINLGISKGAVTGMSGGVDGVAAVAADTVNVNGNVLTAGVDFNVGGSAAATTNNLVNYIHLNTLALGVDAAVNGGTNTQADITANTAGAAGNIINLATSTGAVTSMHGGVDQVVAVAGDTVTVNGTVLTAGVDFNVGGTTAATTSNLVNYIHAHSGILGVDAAVNGGINTKLDITANAAGTAGDSITLATSKGAVTAMAGGGAGIPAVAGDTVNVNGHILTAGVQFNVGGTAADTALNLANYININLGTLGVDAIINSGTNTQLDITAVTPGTAGDSINLTTSKGAVTAMNGGVNGVAAVAADTITINGYTLTAGTDFNIGGNAATTTANLANYIHNNAATLGLDGVVDGTTNTMIDIAAGPGVAFTLAQTGGHATVSGIPLSSTVSFAAADGATQLTKLSEIDQFTDSSGAYMLENPQSLQLIQGDGKKATIQLYGSDTIQNVVDKLNDAIASELGQKDLLASSSDADKFASFVTTAPGSTTGSFIINSAEAGADGKIYVIGNENLINALGLSDIQSATETQFNVTVTDAINPSNIIDSNVAIGGNQLIGVVDKNVDVKFANNTGIDANWNAASGQFELTSAASPATTIVSLVNKTQVFQIGANEKQQIGAAIGDLDSAALGIDTVLVIDRESASNAISTIDAAISKVSAERSSIGAVQNRLEHTINNLGVASENLTSSESRIRDVDMAQETMNYSKLSVLGQASMAMLAQANKNPQIVLQLLQG